MSIKKKVIDFQKGAKERRGICTGNAETASQVKDNSG
jgi:hypothetical protein